MADLPLPGLLPNDPRSCLSEAARRRVWNARAEADLIRTRSLAAIETRYRSEPDPGKGFSEYLTTGQAAIELAEAKMQAARTVLSAVRDEFRAVGKSGQELCQIMQDELEAAVTSLELTTIQRDLLWRELGLFRYTSPDDEIPHAARDRIRAGVLRVHLKRLDGTKVEICLRQAYDEYASELLKGGSPVSDALLATHIPGWVFRDAVEFKWVPYPPQQWERREKVHPDAWIPGAKTVWDEVVPVAESELVETLGGYRVTKEYRSRFERSLERSIAYWRAEALVRAAEGGFPKRDRTQPTMPPDSPGGSSEVAPEVNGGGTKRLQSTVTSPIAARRMEAYMESTGIGQTEFAVQVGTTDRTLRTFRQTGKVRRGIFDAIAKAMGTTREALLKPE
jgi:hypothetical protein